MKPRRSPLQRLALPALAALALFSALPAQAVGRIADVHVIDRDSGEVLPVIRHRGEHWVVGRPGARYAVSVRNTLDARIMSVVSVDGVNVVSGETASWERSAPGSATTSPAGARATPRWPHSTSPQRPRPTPRAPGGPPRWA